jgi:hypothetical protein
VAASLLERAGLPVVHVDDDFENAAKAGFDLAVENAAHGFGEAVTA